MAPGARSNGGTRCFRVFNRLRFSTSTCDAPARAASQDGLGSFARVDGAEQCGRPGGELRVRDPLGGWGAGTRRGRIARTSQPTLHHKKGMHKLQHWSCGSDAPTEAGGVGDAAARRGSATDGFVPSAPTAVCAHVSFPTRPPGVPPTAMARCATTVEVFTPHHQRTSRRRASARRKRRPTTGLPARAGFSCLSDARANALQFWGALVRPGARRGM